MLGFGETDKPTEVSAYYGSGLAQDIVDILDKEGVAKVIGVGHDWGSRVVSRLWNWHPERLIACAFLAVGYGPPTTAYADPIAMMQDIAKWIGYDVLAYMLFFIEEDTPALLEMNFDAFMSLLFPLRGKLWLHNMCATGGAKRWIETNTTLPRADYITTEDYERYRKYLTNGGFKAPLCWYKVQVDEGNKADDARIAEAAYDMNIPVYYIHFKDDWLARSEFAEMSHKQHVKATYKMDAIDATHWGVLSHAATVNNMLLTWLSEQKI